ncbi:MAG TPA: hypothetical protein VF701_15540 [Thermoanaerobaculia bacterium]
MARKHHDESESGGRLERAVSAVKHLFSRKPTAESEIEPRQQDSRKAAPSTARPVRRQTDIPLDVLDRSYNPPVTSSKAGFRSDGSDHHGDQEFVAGADGQWNDEDRYTNKSGDPRIGTHGRTYEPAEARPEPRD